ncbi:MAG: selenocysteine-specific translation elongation factor, partial [Planctomycetes bacterium]|nr:selenocysteine-specific translation elongation factor [Planctomycetota bacterium]
GTNADRLPEEKRRGMTIELGFAHLRLGEFDFGVVDVPGHERFVRTMVSGATGIDVALIVVAADDSVMPQTIEHVEILHLLGVKQAVVAINKCDLVDTDLADLVEAEIEELLEGTPLANSPMVRVSAVKQTGLDQLRTVLIEQASQRVRGHLDLPFRMPIDRVFSVAGRGTVVTGSVLSGQVQAGDTLDLWPQCEPVRVREVQSHGESNPQSHAGRRTAINLQTQGKIAINRGDELAAPGAVLPTRLLDVRLTCLASHRKPIRNHSTMRVCIAAGEVMGRCVCLSSEAIAAGESEYVQLRLAHPIVAAFGQRFIVRDENASRTAGGGVVLRATPRRSSRNMTESVRGLQILDQGDPIERIEERLRYARFTPPTSQRLALDTGASTNEVDSHVSTLQKAGQLISLTGGPKPISAIFLESFLLRATAWIKRYHQMHAQEPGILEETLVGWLQRKSGTPAMGKALLERLVEKAEVKRLGRYVCHKEFAPELSKQDEKLLARVLDLLMAGGFQPPTIDRLVVGTESNKARVNKLLKIAASLGQVVKIDASLYLHEECERQLRERVRGLFESDGPFTVSTLREAIGSSRKYVVPFVEYLDRIGFTKRTGDRREVLAEKQT